MVDVVDGGSWRGRRLILFLRASAEAGPSYQTARPLISITFDSICMTKF